MTDATATRAWTTAAGTKITASITLVLSKTINADGDKIEVDCCELSAVRADVSGHPTQMTFTPFMAPRKQQGQTYVASIGNLGLTAGQARTIREMIDEIKTHPAWIAKQQKISRNRIGIAAMETARRDQPGWCNKCNSLCFGECDA